MAWSAKARAASSAKRKKFHAGSYQKAVSRLFRRELIRQGLHGIKTDPRRLTKVRHVKMVVRGYEQQYSTTRAKLNVMKGWKKGLPAGMRG